MMTDLPLDVTSFRLAPRGDRIALSLEAYLGDCPDLALHAKAHGGEIQSTGFRPRLRQIVRAFIVGHLGGRPQHFGLCIPVHWMPAVT